MMRKNKTKEGNGMLKRLICILMGCMVICGAAGAAAEGEIRGYDTEAGYVYVTFGRYPQSIDGGIPDDGQQAWKWRTLHQSFYKAKENKGKEYDPGELTPEPILWRVLEADGEKVFLMSEYILFSAPLHGDRKEFVTFGGDFTKTDLWKTLNGEFLTTAFTEEEASLLTEREGLGRVFIPSAEEVKDPALGFEKDRSLGGQKANEKTKAWATEYAIRVTHAYVYPITRRNHSPYWLRDPATKKNHGRCTKNYGQIGTYDCQNREEGARPEIWLAPDGFEIESGSGTREDPYAIRPKTGEEAQP